METHVPPCPAYFLRTVVLYWCWSASVNHREPHTKLHVLWSSIIDWQSTFLYFPSLIFPLVLWTSVRTYFKKKKKKILTLGTSLSSLTSRRVPFLLLFFMMFSYDNFVLFIHCKTFTIMLESLNCLYVSFIFCSAFLSVFLSRNVADSVI